MIEKSVVVLGLPGSGKTTYLAAFWHIVSRREIPTRLAFHSLHVDKLGYLNAIAEQWRAARMQEHTPVGSERRVVVSLTTEQGQELRLLFPDISGESVDRMWEERVCDPEIESSVRAGGVLLFVNASTIRAPRWVVDQTALNRQVGAPATGAKEVAWSPHLAPTQVKLMDLLQLLRTAPLDSGPRKLAILLSAWDTVEPAEGLTPRDFLAERLPLLHQYLDLGSDSWNWRVAGVSAQGGAYDSPDGKERGEDADRMRQKDLPSQRVQFVCGTESHDLTEPIAWLLR